MIDGCLQPILAALAEGDPRRERSYLPQSVGRLHPMRSAAGPVSSHVVLRQNADARDNRIVADIKVIDQAGALVARLDGVAFAEVTQPVERQSAPLPADGITYAVAWEPSAGEGATAVARTRGTWLLFVDAKGVGEAFARSLEAAGHSCIRIAAGADGNAHGEVSLDPRDPDAIESAFAALMAATKDVAGVAHFWSLDATAAPGQLARPGRGGSAPCLWQRACGHQGDSRVAARQAHCRCCS